jgi:DNA (cytosine-5)-methyltransferase 1
METQNYVVRQNRGAPRVWLEGARLARAGFVPGVLFCLASNGPGHMMIEASPEGSRKVSGKGDRPIIDLAGRSVMGELKTGDPVTVTYKPGQITIIRGGES